MVVATSNSTTFIESFATNVPTALFWRPEYNELSWEATPHVMDMQRVGIFHSSPQSCARHIRDVWDNPVDWWEDDDVQNVVKNFMTNFAHVGRRPLRAFAIAVKGTPGAVSIPS